VTDQTLLEFPCDFPIKIIGINQADYAQLILAVILRHDPDFDAASMEMRPSGKGNYLGLTCCVHATSKAQLDALYRELTSHPLVKVVL